MTAAPERTPEEIAREIAQYGGNLGEPVHPFVEQRIAAALREYGDARAAQEREDAAKVAEEFCLFPKRGYIDGDPAHSLASRAGDEIAAAIRARRTQG